ncbi:uncharacterized protein METZ01_LOCUS360178, partial [marine metagenome]
MTLGDLLGSNAGVHGSVEITDLVLDSRQVTPGSAFVAVPGIQEHGLSHAEDALRRGAAIIIYEPTSVFSSIPEFSIPVEGLSDRLG